MKNSTKTAAVIFPKNVVNGIKRRFARDIASFGDSKHYVDGAAEWDLLDGWNVWMDTIAIQTPLTTFEQYDRIWYIDKSAIVSTAMILKYASLRYGLNKFVYSDIRNSVSVQEHVQSIKDSFDNSGIILDAIGYFVDADSLDYGIQQYLNENGESRIHVDRTTYNGTPSVFLGDADTVIDNINTPLL